MLRFLIPILFTLFQLKGFAQPQSSDQYDYYGIKEGFPTSEVYDCYEDKTGIMWFGTDAGIVRFNGNDFKLYSVKEGLKNPVAYYFYELRDGSIFVESKLGQYYHIVDDKLTPYAYNDTITKYAGGGSFFYSFYQDEFGNMHFGSRREYLVIDSLGNLVYNTSPYTGADGKSVLTFSFHEDNFFCYTVVIPRENNNHNLRWVNGSDTIKFCVDYTSGSGSASRGTRFGEDWFFNSHSSVLQFTKTGELFVYHQKHVPVALDVIEDKLVVSTLKGGVYEYELENGKLVLKDTLLPDFSITGALKSSDGIWWFSSKGKGVIKQSHPDLRLIYHGKSDVNITAYNRNGNHEIIGFEDATVIIKNDSTNEAMQLNIPIYDVVNLALDTIVFASRRGGVYDLKTNSFINQSFNRTKITDSVYMLRTAISERYFVGEEIDRFTVYERNNGKLTPISQAEFSEKFFCVEILGEHMYIGHTRGVSIAELSTGKFIKEIDLKENVSSLVKLNGKILAITISGKVILIDETNHAKYIEIKRNEMMPLIFAFKSDQTVFSDNLMGVHSWEKKNGNWQVSNFYKVIDYIKVNSGQEENYLVTTRNVYAVPKNRSRSVTPHIYIRSVQVNKDSVLFDQDPVLNHRQNNFKFTFESVGYISDDHLFRYRLINHDLDFIYTRESQAYYAELAPGKYTFEVQSTVGGYTYSPKSQVHFTILAPYWQQTWFYLLVVLCTFLLIWIIYKLRVRHIRKIDKLNLSIYHLKSRALASQLNPHLVFNILNSIQGMIAKSDREKANNTLADFAVYMRKALDLSRLNTVPLSEEIFITKQYIDLELIRFQDSVTIHMHENPSPTIPVAPLLIQPLVENAIKHGIMPSENVRLGEINIYFRALENRLEIEVTDNGTGVADVGKLYKSDGLRIIRERIKNLHPQNTLTYRRDNEISKFTISIFK